MTDSLREHLIETLKDAQSVAGLDSINVDWNNGAAPVDIAVKCGLTHEQIARAIARSLGLQIVEHLREHNVSETFIEKIPIGFARQHKMIGLDNDSGEISVAFCDLDGWEQIDTVARYLGKPIQPIIAPQNAIEAAINLAYQKKSGQTEEFIGTLNGKENEQPVSREDLLDVANRAPVVKLVSLLLFEAVKQQASDIHLQPYENKLVVRLRLDGVLFDSYELPKHLQEEIISRIKVMSRLNIAEKRLPQDGRTSVEVGGRMIDLRISVIPSSYGERVVIRLLDKASQLFGLSELGMDDHTLELFRKILSIEHGLTLVTGPTGSGKSTTLYASLQEINTEQSNILTLEDPIEYQLEGISQTQVSDKRGMTFASGLKSVLRQDPDIIMVGEIRDHETAVMAIQSALTGHMVFSTLHTNDAASAVTRLLDLGIESYLVASSLVGVLAQRLVRRVCPACAQPANPTPQQLAQLNLPADTDTSKMLIGRGCELCRNTGYRGRLGLFELLAVDDNIRQRMQENCTAAMIRDVALAAGMRTLRHQGVDNVLNGDTTIEEVLRVTMRMEL